jgi:hypothetical protein
MSELTLVAPAPSAPHEEHASFWGRVFRFAISEVETLGRSDVMNLIPEPERGIATIVVDVITAADQGVSAPGVAAPPVLPSVPAMQIPPAATTQGSDGI